MGWKALKDKFGIGHLVCVTEKGICIGSGYVTDLVVVHLDTGMVKENLAFQGFLEREYPALSAASPAEILELINAADSFSVSIPVYTYEGSQILEKYCEEPGWPNVTHDGCLMYENTFFASKDAAIAAARLEAGHLLDWANRKVQETHAELAKWQAQLSECETRCREIEAALPGSLGSPAT